MSEPHPYSGQANRPTRKQMVALRKLAAARGQTFAYPATRAEASAEIARLLRTPGSTRAERAIEIHTGQQIAPPMSSAAVREDEILGHGGSARWARRSGEAMS